MQNFVSDISFNSYDNALVLPAVTEGRLGGVVDNEGNFIWKSAYRYEELNLWGGAYTPDEQSIVNCEEEVIYLGMLQKHWGNFLFDNLNRAWYLLNASPNMKVVYCGFDVHDADLWDSKNNYAGVLNSLGITSDRLIEITVPTRFKRVIIPDMALFPGTYYSKQIKELYGAMILDAKACEPQDSLSAEDKVQNICTSANRIYLTRTGMAVKKEIGEKQIERVFKKNGYKIVSPERMSQRELITLVNNCDSMAAIEGTITHNTIFAKAGTEVILLRKLNYENTRQKLFDEAAGVKEIYVDIYYEPYKSFPINHDTGPYLIGLSSKLCEVLRGQGFKISVFDRILSAAALVGNMMIYSLKCMYYKLVLKY